MPVELRNGPDRVGERLSDRRSIARDADFHPEQMVFVLTAEDVDFTVDVEGRFIDERDAVLGGGWLMKLTGRRWASS